MFFEEETDLEEDSISFEEETDFEEDSVSFEEETDFEEDSVSFEEETDFEEDSISFEEETDLEEDSVSFEEETDFEEDSVSFEEETDFEEDDISFEDEMTCEENEIIPQKKPDYTEIGIHKLKTYHIRSEDITNKAGTKRYIKVLINNEFKFCPDFFIDYATKGEGFLYDDHIIMAFYRSDDHLLGLYKIKSQGKKITTLYTVEIKKYDSESIAFYETDDGRYILSCSQTILFFTLSKKPEYQCYKIENEFSGITALYSGDRMLLYKKKNEYHNNDKVWFDGEKDIDIFQTEWVRRAVEVCEAHAYNYNFNNAPYRILDNSYPSPEISFTDRKRVIIDYDFYNSWDFEDEDEDGFGYYEDEEKIYYYLERDGRIFCGDTEIFPEDKLQIDNDVSGYEDIVEHMITILQYDSYIRKLLKKDSRHYKNIKCFHFYSKSRTFVDVSVTFKMNTPHWSGNNFSNRVKYDVDNNIISVYNMNSNEAKYIIKEHDKLLSNLKLYPQKADLEEKFKDRLGWFYEVQEKVFGKSKIAFVAGFVADKRIHFSYPPKNSNGLQIPDADINGLFVLVLSDKYDYPLALRIMLNSQTVYGYRLTEEDKNIILENKMLWKDWYRSRRENFELVFKLANGHLFTAERFPLPANSPFENTFSIEKTKEILASSGIQSEICGTIYNGKKVSFYKYNTNATGHSYRLIFDLNVFGEKIGSEYINNSGYSLCQKGLLIAINDSIYLMTDLCSPKKEFLHMDEQIAYIICTDRYLFVTTCDAQVKKESGSYIGGQSSYWNEGELVEYTHTTITEIPTTHIYDLTTNTKLGSVNMLGSIPEIIRETDSYRITCIEKTESNELQKKTYRISSSPEKIVSDLQRITENLV